MTIYALVSEISPVRLWGLDSAQRLKRQLSEISKDSQADLGDIRWLSNVDEVPRNGRVLLLNGAFLFENRTLRGVLDRPDSILQHGDGAFAAAFVEAAQANDALALLQDNEQDSAARLHIISTRDMEAFDENLRRSAKPLLEPINIDSQAQLESRLYGNAYRGITDLVTKFLWPRPAKQVVHLCARMQVSPNMVTSLGLLLVLAACYLFLKGHYGWGLLAGWVMTFLDTVDGKLARVTIQSSKFGHLFDHAIDLIHPPFWYIFWGMSLLEFQPPFGLPMEQMNQAIVMAYISGRIVEGLFPLLGSCSIFTWRPFDAWFRLITARRNPCLILLTMSVLVGRPDWGFVAVTGWSVITSLVLILRLLQAALVRLTSGPLNSWLSQDEVATGPHARSYSVFGATRSAYARQK